MEGFPRSESSLSIACCGEAGGEELGGGGGAESAPLSGARSAKYPSGARVKEMYRLTVRSN